MNIMRSVWAAALVVMIAPPGHADDKPLIWQPAKTSDTSYSVKLGLKLPTRIETQAGISMGVNTTASGAPVDAPIKFWGNFTAEKIQTPAYEANRNIGLNLNGNNGNAAITMNYYEKEIATPTVDIERRSSYGMRYDGVSGTWQGPDASQSLRLSHAPSGMAFIGRASGSNGFKTIGAGMEVEKKVGRNILVSGSLDRTSDVAETIASVNARYSFHW